jgi:cytochrome c556
VNVRLATALAVAAVTCAGVTLAQQTRVLAQSQPGPLQTHSVLSGQPPAAVVPATVAPAEVSPAEVSPAEVVRERQHGLKRLGAAFKVIRDELRRDSPDAAKIRAASADITQAASAIGSWFPRGTGPDSGINTDARPEVWTDAAGFTAAQDTFIHEANKWNRLGSSADAAAWKEAATSLGQSCRDCHDKYRLKKE